MSLLSLLVKEEFRTNTIWVDPKIYALMPAFFALLLTGVFGAVTEFGMNLGVSVQAVLLLSFLIGLPSGFVTFMRREMFSHNIGETSFLVSNAYNLPIPNPDLLAAFIMREFVFAFTFFMLPLTIALSLSGADPVMLLASLVLSYLYGVLLSFLFSTTFSHFRGMTLLLIAAFLYLVAVRPENTLPFLFFYPALANLSNYSLSTGLLLLALPFASFHYEPSIRKWRAHYDRARALVRTPHLAKDLIAVWRTGFFLAYTLYQIAVIVSFLALVSVLPARIFLPYTLGLFSILPWFILNFLDQPHIYSHLPLPEKSFLRSKLSVFSLTSLTGLLLILLTGLFVSLSPAVSAFIYLSSGAYALFVTYKLVGLDIQLLFKPRKMFLFLLALLPYGMVLDMAVLTGSLAEFAFVYGALGLLFTKS